MMQPSAIGAERRRARLARAVQKAEDNLIASVRARGATPEQVAALRKMLEDTRTSPSLRAAVAAANLRQ